MGDASRRYYLADGSYEILDSEEEVIKRRKAAAVELENLRSERDMLLGVLKTMVVVAKLLIER